MLLRGNATGAQETCTHFLRTQALFQLVQILGVVEKNKNFNE